MSITLQQLTYTYETDSRRPTPAVNQVSFQVERGEIFAIIGPTGSGKSTLVQLMAGLLRPSAGEIWIGDENLWARRIDRRRLRLQVGLVFQYPEHQLFGATVGEDVAFGPRNLGLAADAVEQRVKDTLGLVGLDTSILDRSPHHLSGGQMRRVALAGILAMKPRILILDEPTAGLDPYGRNSLLRLLSHLNRQEGLTIILVSHNMDEVAQVAQKVAVLDRGSVVMKGPIRQVYSQVERLRQLGLDVPVATQVVSLLARRGWAIASDLMTLDEAAAGIMGALAKSTGREAGPSA